MEKRVIHSRKKVRDIDRIFTNKFELLTWVLSILKWKEYGYTTVFYCDDSTYNKMKEFGIEKLYDEINIDILESCELCGNIHFEHYWAMSKFLAYENEIKLNHNPLISDTDIIPMKDISFMLNMSDILIWSNKEYLLYNAVYPSINKLSLPDGYELPEWFTGAEKPLNTGVLHFRDTKNALEYISNVKKWVDGNENKLNNNPAASMCNPEQRMLGELAAHKGWGYFTVQPINKSIFNENAIHTHGYKDHWELIMKLKKPELSNKWIINILLMIRKLNEKYFNELMEYEFLKDEKKYFEENGYTCEVVKELQQYENIF